MRDVTPTGLPPTTDLPHRRKQHLVQHASQTQGATGGIQESADGLGVESMHRVEEGFDLPIDRARLLLYHPSGGGAGGMAARYFIAHLAERS
jgi:hypothetical protein